MKRSGVRSVVHNTIFQVLPAESEMIPGGSNRSESLLNFSEKFRRAASSQKEISNPGLKTNSEL
jgi:hypothetical protein